MTGKDIVLYIINNNLLDIEFDSKVKHLFLTVEEAAVKLGVSTTSLMDMIRLGLIDYVTFNEVIYLHRDVELIPAYQAKRKERL